MGPPPPSPLQVVNLNLSTVLLQNLSRGGGLWKEGAFLSHFLFLPLQAVRHFNTSYSSHSILEKKLSMKHNKSFKFFSSLTIMSF